MGTLNFSNVSMNWNWGSWSCSSKLHAPNYTDTGLSTFAKIKYKEPFGWMRTVRISFPRWINAKVPMNQPLRTQGSGVPGALNMRTVSNVKLSHIELFCTSTCSDFHGLLIVLVDQCIAWRKICWNDGGFGPSPLVSCGLWLIHLRSINLGSGGQYPNHLDGYGNSEAAGFKHRLTLRAVMNQLNK